MKQLTSYNRVAGYLNKLFDLLNQRFFENELARPTITIQRWERHTKSISELERWQDPLKLSALPFCMRCAITTPMSILSKTPAVAIPTTTNASSRLQNPMV